MTDLGTIDGPLLVFGGPYSNFAATAAMRARVDELGLSPAQVICTGDVVAYCGEPCETLDLIHDWGVHLVMGNCEESLAFGEDDCGCGFEPDSACSILAVTWYEFANRRVTAEQRRWMSNLPRAIEFSLAGTRFRVVHGSLDSINEFVFASSDKQGALQQMRDDGIDCVIGGHCGIPFGQHLEERHWLNAGVIGMPANDGGQHGWYLLLEPGEQGIEASWHRLVYNYSLSRQTTVAAGMQAYGEALASGLWPSIDILPGAEAGQTGQKLDPAPLVLGTSVAVKQESVSA